MMKMFFHFSIMETILFEKWMTTTEFQMTASCFLLLMLAITLEFIKTLRVQLQQKCPTDCLPSNVDETSDREHLILGWTRKGRKHLGDTFLYGFQLTISYMLMLAVMTYNVWITASVVIGAVIGYFLFGENTYAQDRTKDAHCN